MTSDDDDDDDDNDDTCGNAYPGWLCHSAVFHCELFALSVETADTDRISVLIAWTLAPTELSHCLTASLSDDAWR